MRRHRRIASWFAVTAAFWLALGFSPVAQEDVVRHVLLLQSFNRGSLALDHFTSNFRVDLDERVGRRVNVIEVVVGPTGFVGAAEEAVVEYIQATFADRPKPDLIVTVGGPAATFGRKYRARIFPDSPLVFAAVDQRFVDRAPLAENETAVSVRNDGAAIVDEILRLLPDTRRVMMVVGGGPLGQFWKSELTRDFTRFGDRLAFEWTDHLSLPEILRRTRELPDHSAIFYVLFSSDASGAAYSDERVLHALHEIGTAPIFGVHTVYVGLGAVGGTVMSIDDLSHDASEVAIRILNGAAPASLRSAAREPGPPLFDWRELRRWGIPVKRLPSGSVVRFTAPTLWGQHRTAILVTLAALIAQSTLIIGLLYQRRARQRAEIDSKRNLTLAADASRRQTMSALTNSMTHELGQPLSSVIQNAQALQLMIDANQAPPEMVREIVGDIQTQGVRAAQIVDRHRSMLRSHDLVKKPLDANSIVKDSLTLVSHDLKSRGVETTADLSRIACEVSGDQVLLRQVLVNLIMNAADAMADTAPARRRVTITSEVHGDRVHISVRDRGTGLPAQLDGQLFSPFATTKPNGLGIGLTIVRTIVDAHGGAIEATNNPDGGATFQLTLPRGGA